MSESEEEGPLFIQTPPREKDKSTSGTDSSPKPSAVGKRMSQKKTCIPAKYSERARVQSRRLLITVPPQVKDALKLSAHH